MKKKNGMLTSLVVIALITAGAIGLFKHFHIKAFCVIKPQVLYTSGQPRGMDYTRLLYKYHIMTIINIRPVSEHQERNWRNEEITWTRGSGVNYIELPIEKSSSPDEQTQQRFLEIMSRKNNLPVLLHGSGDDKRVALLAAVWLRKAEGWTSEQTLEVAKEIIGDKELTGGETEFIRLLAK